MIKIVSDSSCDKKFLEKVPFSRVPLILTIDDIDYVDNVNLDTYELQEAIKNCKTKMTSSCPSAQAYFDAAIDSDEVILVAITSGLSGSLNAARVAKEMLEDEGKKVLIVDSMSASAGVCLIVEKLEEFVLEGLSLEEIGEKIEDYKNRMKLNFALANVDNFVKSGRIPKILGDSIKALKLSLVCTASEEGKVKVINKARTIKKGINSLYDEMIKNGFNGGKVIISHTFNFEGAENLKKKVLEAFPNTNITLYETSGLCTYYAGELGVLVAYEI